MPNQPIYAAWGRVSTSSQNTKAQEYAINGYAEANNITISHSYNTTCSAYKSNNGMHTILRNFINTLSNNTNLIVFAIDRLSRKKIFFVNKILPVMKKKCIKLIVLSMRNKTFDMTNIHDQKCVCDLVEEGQKESETLGRRLRLSAEYKKSKIPEFGFERKTDWSLVPNPFEQDIIKLVRILRNRNSDISELLEKHGIDGEVQTPLTISGIVRCFDDNNIKLRNRKFTAKDIGNIISNRPILTSKVNVENMANSFARF